MISWTCSSFGPIGPRTTEFSALESLKNTPPHSLIMGMMVSPLFHGCLCVILIMLAGNKNIHKCLDEFKFWPNLATEYGVSCP